MPSNNSVGELLLQTTKKLSKEVSKHSFSDPVTHIYNPLDYAWPAHKKYIETYADKCDVIFIGMNPGPFGMAQTGIPFGEITAVKDWLGITAKIGRPANEHEKRPILGFDCQRSEVSGRRLWGLFKEIYKSPESFFKKHYVANYCPLVFMEESGKNRTPDKLSTSEKEKLFKACDTHLTGLVEIMQPQWVIGIGKFAENRALDALKPINVKIGGIMHPSPANPHANRDWAGIVKRQLKDLGIW